MQIQVHTDNHIEGHETLTAWAAEEVTRALSRQSSHITRVEVHLSDASGQKEGLSDKRCMMEARVEGRPPLAVTHHADNLHQAVTGAAEKLNRLIDHSLERASRPVPEPVPLSE